MRFFNTPPPSGPEVEDCLSLNVYTPGKAAPGSKPVMFLIYGGGFSFGSASLPLYNASSLVLNQNIIVVTAYYRTNLLGFPGLPAINRTEQNLW